MNSANLVIAPVLLPLLMGLAQLALPSGWARARAGLGLASAAGLLALAGALLLRTGTGEVLVHALGDWPAPFGIVLVADRLAAIMLALAAVPALAALVYALGDRDARLRDPLFHPLFQFLLLGLNAAFLTGDLFNLFVCYEIMLIASYALVVLGGGKRSLRPAFHYVALNLFNSTLFLLGLGLLYGLTGTLNLAHLAERVPALPAGAPLAAVELVFLFVFAFKAALVPLFFWLPDTYPALSTPTAALFAGLMTKVGVYSLLRVFGLAFGGPDAHAADWILALAGATMLGGVLGAVCQGRFKRLLSFHIISQVGYMVMGIGLFTAAGVAGAISYLIHHIMVKASLFLIAGTAERLTGSDYLKDMGGLVARPAYAALFLVAGLSLAGMPPLSGFFSKFAVISAGFEVGAYWVVASALLAGLLTLFSMIKVWVNAFWGASRRPLPAIAPSALAAAGLLVSFSVTLPLWGEAVYRLAHEAAVQLLDARAYVSAVLGREAP